MDEMQGKYQHNGGILRHIEHSKAKLKQSVCLFPEEVYCKNTTLSLIHLSQLIGYSCIALPIYSILLSLQGMGTTLNKLLKNYNRQDILEFRPKRTIQVIKWDESKQDVDYMNSIVK